MITVIHCTVCGKRLQGVEMRCAYCKRALCNEHYINNLCPNHQHTMTPEQARIITTETNSSLWILALACLIGIPALAIGILALIFSDTNKRFYGIIFIVVAVVVLTLAWYFNKKSKNKTSKIYDEVMINYPLPQNCPKCGGLMPKNRLICPQCNIDIRAISNISRSPVISTDMNVLLQNYESVEIVSQRICPNCKRNIDSNLPSKNCPYCLAQL